MTETLKNYTGYLNAHLPPASYSTRASDVHWVLLCDVHTRSVDDHPLLFLLYDLYEPVEKRDAGQAGSKPCPPQAVSTSELLISTCCPRGPQGGTQECAERGRSADMVKKKVTALVTDDSHSEMCV